MQMNLHTRRFAAWAACLAILLSALAPSLSHALALARGSDSAWMEVCSVAGTKLVQAETGVTAAGSPSSHDALKDAGHCLFCGTHAASFALPPTASLTFHAAAAARPWPRLFYQSPRPLACWATAHPRAPPLFS
jgi:hypothetical protein